MADYGAALNTGIHTSFTARGDAESSSTVGYVEIYCTCTVAEFQVHATSDPMHDLSECEKPFPG